MRQADYRKMMGNWSQRRFAEEIGLSTASVCRYESGERLPDEEAMVKILIGSKWKIRYEDYLALRHKEILASAEGSDNVSAGNDSLG